MKYRNARSLGAYKSALCEIPWVHKIFQEDASPIHTCKKADQRRVKIVTSSPNSVCPCSQPQWSLPAVVGDYQLPKDIKLIKLESFSSLTMSLIWSEVRLVLKSTVSSRILMVAVEDEAWKMVATLMVPLVGRSK